MLLLSLYSVSIELPGGLVDKGETIEQACLRELGEETSQSGIVEVRYYKVIQWIKPLNKGHFGESNIKYATLRDVLI